MTGVGDAQAPVRRFRFRTPRKVTLWLTLLGVVPIIVLGAYAYRAGARAIDDLVRANNRAVAKVTAALLRTELTQRIDDARGFARLPGVRAHVERRNAQAVRARLRAFVTARDRVVRGFVTDKEGLLWTDYPRAPESLGKTFAYRDWYEGVSRSWSPYVSEVYQRHADPRPLVVSVAVPVRDAAGRVRGTFVHQLRLEGLTEVTRQVEVGHGGYVYVVDHTGTVAAHPHLDLQARPYKSYAKTPTVKGIEGRETNVVEYVDPVSGRHMLAAAVPVVFASHTWVAVAQQPVEEAYAAVSSLGLNIAAAGGLLLLAGIAVVVALGRAYDRTQDLNRRLESRAATLAETTSQLEHTNQELESFTYSVSHDLRTPLIRMAGFSRALLEDYGESLDERGRHYAERVQASAGRMGQLIDDLMRLSRVSRTELRRRSVDVSTIADEIVQELRRQDPGRDVEVHIVADLRMHADPALLRIVLQNLLENAWKFTRDADHPRIELGSCSHDGERVCVVSDNGAGFDASYAGKLFTPFQRLHHEEEFAGTGIGLATVQRIVHRHGGHAWAEGTPGRGARFFFSIPAGGHAKDP